MIIGYILGSLFIIGAGVTLYIFIRSKKRYAMSGTELSRKLVINTNNESVKSDNENYVWDIKNEKIISI